MDFAVSILHSPFSIFQGEARISMARVVWLIWAGLALTVACWTLGCGGAGSGALLPGGNPVPPGVAFSAVQAIFTQHCARAGCHAPPAPVLGQDLSDGAAFQSIVNKPSSELPAMDRVEPGDPAKSYLLHKVKGTQANVGGGGAQMPLGGPFLSDQEIATIENWIKEGAKP